ncbi:MAG: hypothetical protein PHZ27_05645 [Candidatus Omnitrophica bacterium]|nr:hypothetical protein [Candidatus Omnitrophota bacterium]MDD5441672.1 hypothetical protein [Candidatus Omnitrophota bacterium]
MTDKNNRKNWSNPELIKIKLNPEQAVLSCCDNTSRNAYIGGSLPGQCAVGGCGGAGSAGPSS